jgi:hypothetical protein
MILPKQVSFSWLFSKSRGGAMLQHFPGSFDVVISAWCPDKLIVCPQLLAEFKASSIGKFIIEKQ